MYGVWAFPFSHAGIELPVYLIDRPIATGADHNNAKRDIAHQIKQGKTDVP
jgi:hypothetical protein